MGKIFAVIAVVMVTIIAVGLTVTIRETEVRQARKHPALFEIAPQQVDGITIEGPAGETLALRRHDGGWILPDLDDFPADAEEVDDMLARLLTAERNLPLSSDPEALRRFKLADDEFERRLTLSGGDKVLATVLIGTPEGPRQVHLRRAGETTAYSVRFGLYDASVDPDDWFDHGFLQFPEKEVASIRVNGLHLVAGNRGHWRLDPAATAEGPELDGNAAAHLAGLLAGLRVEALRLDETAPDYALDSPELTLTLSRKDGREITYRLGRTAQQKDYTLEVSTRAERFHLSVYSATQLIRAADPKALRPAGRHHAATTDPQAGSATSHN